MTTEILPTADQITAARVAGRLAAQPEPRPAGKAPLPPLVSPEVIVQARVAASLGTFDQTPPALAAAKSTGRLVAERAAEDAAELELFCEVVADHFDCDALLDQRHRVRMQAIFVELRRVVRQLRGEAERAAADPTATA